MEPRPAGGSVLRRAALGTVALTAVLPLPAPAIQASGARDARPPAAFASREPEDHGTRFETHHFVILGREGVGSPTEIARAGDRAERAHDALRELLGDERTPTRKLTIVLEGDGLAGGDLYPHVDASGVIHLYRFTDEFDDHFDSLLHEMVHAFRRGTGRPWVDGFREEGLAQAIVLALEPPEVHFPLWGHPLDLVAGHLVATERDIPLPTLRHMHPQLNLPCRLQSYVQRASFFEHLTREFGLDAVISLVYDRPAGGVDPFVMAFGSTLDVLAEGWREALLERYRALPDATGAWTAFRDSPGGELPICERSTLTVGVWL